MKFSLICILSIALAQNGKSDVLVGQFRIIQDMIQMMKVEKIDVAALASAKVFNDYISSILISF